jgi:hypothetical protein
MLCIHMLFEKYYVSIDFFVVFFFYYEEFSYDKLYGSIFFVLMSNIYFYGLITLLIISFGIKFPIHLLHEFSYNV